MAGGSPPTPCTPPPALSTTRRNLPPLHTAPEGPPSTPLLAAAGSARGWGVREGRGVGAEETTSGDPRPQLSGSTQKITCLLGILRLDPKLNPDLLWPRPQRSETPTEPQVVYLCPPPHFLSPSLPCSTPLPPCSQLTHTHQVLGVFGAKAELVLRREEVKRAPRQTERCTGSVPRAGEGPVGAWGLGGGGQVTGQREGGRLGVSLEEVPLTRPARDPPTPASGRRCGRCDPGNRTGSHPEPRPDAPPLRAGRAPA